MEPTGLVSVGSFFVDGEMVWLVVLVVLEKLDGGRMRGWWIRGAALFLVKNGFGEGELLRG